MADVRTDSRHRCTGYVGSHVVLGLLDRGHEVVVFDDLAAGPRRIRPLDLPRTQSCRYNLGNGQGHSVREVIETARRVTGIDIPVRIGPRRPGDPAVLVAASDRIRTELGWKPSVRRPGDHHRDGVALAQSTSRRLCPASLVGRCNSGGQRRPKRNGATRGAAPPVRLSSFDEIRSPCRPCRRPAPPGRAFSPASRRSSPRW